MERDVWGDGQGWEYVIRKKQLQLKQEYVEFFGFRIDSIKMLNKEQFETFIDHKRKFEAKILEQ